MSAFSRALVLAVTMAMVQASLCWGQTPPWPPEVGSDWPPSFGGGNDTGKYAADPNHVDGNGDPNELPADSGPLGDALDVMDDIDPAVAAQVRAAHANGAIGFFAIAPGQGVAGAYRHDNASLLLVVEGRDKYDICATLAHEMEHARRRSGCYGVPTTHGEEDGDCGHTAAWGAQLRAMEQMNQASLELDPTPISCEQYARAKRQCEDRRDKCIAAGGTPANDCSGSIDCR